MIIRKEMEEREAQTLSPYACLSKNSKGREVPDTECDIRTAFQRDRDRLIHSKTFRRLKHKTQVFLAPTGDHYRTRLTHVLEVSQIARTVATALRINVHLVEAIALGHDLGHTPFGHAGESILNELYPGGFRHYEQSLRVVDILEKNGRGLNLTHEVRNGIIKHSKGRKAVLPDDLSGLPDTLEGQVVRIADIIAYVNHDLDDAQRAGVIQGSDVPSHIRKALGEKHSERIGTMVKDLITETLAGDDGKLTISTEVLEAITDLRAFLYANVYEANKVHNDFIKAIKVIRELYDYFLEHPIPWDIPQNALDSELSPEMLKHRQVCDFIAGMTDRYALDLYVNIFIPKPWSVV